MRQSTENRRDGRRAGVPAPHRCGDRLLGQRVGQLSCKSALGFMVPLAPLWLAAAAATVRVTSCAAVGSLFPHTVCATVRVTSCAAVGSLFPATGCCLLCLGCTFALGRLRWVRPEQFV